MTELNVKSQTKQPQSPGVHFPPPALFVVAIGIGCGIEMVFPLPLTSLIPIPGRPLIGWIAIAVGAPMLLWALTTFRRSRTAVYPNQPASQIVCTGPYCFSRNPMYVALTCINFGVAMLADNLWMLLMLPIVLWFLTVFVIRREEAYLTEAFGEEYTTYLQRVRRWI